MRVPKLPSAGPGMTISQSISHFMPIRPRGTTWHNVLLQSVGMLIPAGARLSLSANANSLKSRAALYLPQLLVTASITLPPTSTCTSRRRFGQDPLHLDRPHQH